MKITVAALLHRAHFGQGTGRIVLDNVQCAGTEHDLMECSHNEVFDHNCDHGEDAGVACTSEQFCFKSSLFKDMYNCCT